MPSRNAKRLGHLFPTVHTDGQDFVDGVFLGSGEGL